MSWLARSLANSLIADDGDGDKPRDSGAAASDGCSLRPPPPGADGSGGGEESSPAPDGADPSRGVKEDISELTQTLGRQFRGVASFLAPPPSVSPSDRDPRPDPTVPRQSEREEDAEAAAAGVDSPRIGGIRSDFAEIGGRFKTGISMLSSNAAIGMIASNLIPFRPEEGQAVRHGNEEEESEEEEVEEEDEEDQKEEEGEEIELSSVGVTDEVMVFARNIAMHPETWLDFPLFNEFEDTDDFEMSDVQQDHAYAVGTLEPRLAALRIELCPTHMSEACFWKIYFVLLHSRLKKHDAELLSTPQIAEARAMLLQKLQNRNKPDYGTSSRDSHYRNADSSYSPRQQLPSPSGILSETNAANLHSSEGSTSTPPANSEAGKPAALASEAEPAGSPAVEEQPTTQPKNRVLAKNFSEISIQDYDDDDDDWPEDEEAGVSGSTPMPFGNQEDVSFSDLEDDEPLAPSSSKKTDPSGSTLSKH